MRHLVSISALVLVLASPLAGQGNVTPMARLAGCWQAGSIRESWILRPKGGLIGVGAVVQGDRREVTERLRLDAPAGRILYQATPTGERTTEFWATMAVSQDSFVVEAPLNDFPRRISYVFDGDDRINVLLTGFEAGVPRERRFRFTRMAECSAVADVGLAAIPPGGRVRVAAQSKLLSGSLQDVTADALLLRVDDGTTRIPYADIATVWGRRRSTLNGAVIGGVIGAAMTTAFFHVIITFACESTTGCPDDRRRAWGYGIVLGGAGGGLIGAGVGSLISKWGQKAP